MQINEPRIEKKLSKSIITLGKIKDSVSKKVRDQYEDNPYPRWRYTYLNIPASSTGIINSLIKPNKIEINKKFDNPKVLIAGCGTGKQVLLAKGYKNSKILAVDLSIRSLAYAKRKVKELNLKNISFLHADILQLKKLKSKFDIIECAGVLHHMKNPHKGLKELLSLLEPHGIIRLGLYSELARKDVIKVRNLIKNKKYKNTSKDIKICREEVIQNVDDELMKKLLFRRDFYTTSSARDLMFHTQEHRFTINELHNILNIENLEFLGFNNNLAKVKFATIYPDDKKQILLDNWSKFEINNTETFFGMYDFLIRRNSPK
jgi:ubiquinone/menaquinone biosynthesis C-methylase UbiE